MELFEIRIPTYLKYVYLCHCYSKCLTKREHLWQFVVGDRINNLQITYYNKQITL